MAWHTIIYVQASITLCKASSLKDYIEEKKTKKKGMGYIEQSMGKAVITTAHERASEEGRSAREEETYSVDAAPRWPELKLSM